MSIVGKCVGLGAAGEVKVLVAPVVVGKVVVVTRVVSSSMWIT